MINPIDNLIKETFVYKVDMLRNLSLSANVSMIKYALAYSDFDPMKTYPLDEDIKSSYKLTQKYWDNKVYHYLEQDQNKKRDSTNNVTSEDFDYYYSLILKSVCKICGSAFT